MVGDEIVQINGKSVREKTKLDSILQNSNGETLKVIVKRENQYIEYEINPTAIPTKNLGIYLSASEDIAEIAAITPKSPAENRLQVKDEIVKVNGVDVQKDVNKVIQEITKAQTEEITFTINRKGETLEFNIKPEIVYSYVLGIELEKVEKNLGNSLYYGWIDTTKFAFSIVDNIKMLLNGNASVNQLMGPVGIAQVVTKTDNVENYIYLFALISLSLGVTNLLPFPPLDGGKVVILLIEAIRKKPLKEKTEIQIQMLGFALLIGLSLYVTYNDILRIF